VKFLQPASEVSFDLTKTKDNGKGMKVGKLQGNRIFVVVFTRKKVFAFYYPKYE
jgi:hypothetical protein